MTTERLPTQAGRKALLNIAAGRAANHGLYGMSAHGGHTGTMLALKKNGLVTENNQLTDAGSVMVVRLTLKPEVRHD